MLRWVSVPPLGTVLLADTQSFPVDWTLNIASHLPTHHFNAPTVSYPFTSFPSLFSLGFQISIRQLLLLFIKSRGFGESCAFTLSQGTLTRLFSHSSCSMALAFPLPLLSFPDHSNPSQDPPSRHAPLTPTSLLPSPTAPPCLNHQFWPLPVQHLLRLPTVPQIPQSKGE